MSSNRVNWKESESLITQDYLLESDDELGVSDVSGEFSPSEHSHDEDDVTATESMEITPTTENVVPAVGINRGTLSIVLPLSPCPSPPAASATVTSDVMAETPVDDQLQPPAVLEAASNVSRSASRKVNIKYIIFEISLIND